MSMVDVIAIEPFDGHQPGQTVPVTERQAAQLVAKGLAKMVGPHSNKMARATENKANPSKAAGGVRLSSASRAAPASTKPTARTSRTGANAGKTDE